MNLPTREEAQKLLEKHVQDKYQLYHAKIVTTAMEGYAGLYGENTDLWYLTGFLHDVDFEEHPETHPTESLKWFKEWGYPEDLIHAVEAHAYGYNNFSTLPHSKLAVGLMACDEICGLFYAYQKLNPIPFGQMKVNSIKKRLSEKNFAAKIDRDIISRGTEALGINIDEHIENLIRFLGKLD